MVLTSDPIYELIDQEQSIFLKVLHHDSRGGKINRTFLDNGKVKGYVFDSNISKLETYSPKYNSYISVNSYKSKKRKADNIYNYSSIFIDLDCHTLSKDDLSSCIDNTLLYLSEQIQNRIIPEPTMITATGRGLGIYYVLEHSIANVVKAQNSINFYHQVKDALYARYNDILSGQSGLLEVDHSTSDDARICRMPLTYNSKAQKWCRLIHIGHDIEDETAYKYYELKELVNDYDLFSSVNTNVITFHKRKSNYSERELVNDYNLFSSVNTNVITFHKQKSNYSERDFLQNRLKQIIKLQRIRNYDCIGSRELMCFLYYNTATQLYGNDAAMEMLVNFNVAFVTPLKPNELTAIKRCTDKKKDADGSVIGFYKISNQKMSAYLCLSDAEKIALNICSSRAEIRKKNKAENQAKRLTRNSEIAQYIIDNPKKTYKEIAEHFSLSERTIKRIAKSAEIKRNNSNTKAVSSKPAADNCPVNKKGQKMPQYIYGVSFKKKITDYSIPGSEKFDNLIVLESQSNCFVPKMKEKLMHENISSFSYAKNEHIFVKRILKYYHIIEYPKEKSG